MLRTSLLVLILTQIGQTSGQQISVRLDSLFRSNAGPGLAVGIFKDGQVVYEYFSGWSDHRQSKPINRETTFWIASVSKQFTAMAITALEAEGKISVDDPVSRYLPELARFPDIKIRHLLHHTSGLRDGYTLIGMTLKGERHYDPISVLGMLAKQKELNFEPGTRFEYINSNYVLLAVIVERVSKRPFADFMKRDVFLPLGMPQARVYQREHTATDAIGCVRKNGRYKTVDKYLPAIGSSGVMMSLSDAVQLEKQFHESDCNLMVDRMRQTTTLNDGAELHYARGLEKYKVDSTIVFSHFGSDPGFRADILRIPHERLSVIIFSNASDYWSLTRNLFDAAGIVLHRDFGARVKPSLMHTRLNSFAGVYVDTVAGSSARFIKVRDGKLTVSTSLNGYYADLNRVSAEHFLKDDYYEISYTFNERSLRVERPGGPNMFVKMDSSSIRRNNKGLKGTYYSAELGKRYRITYKKGNLRLSFLRIIHSRLHPIGDNAFYSEFAGGNVLKFVRESEKDILMFNRDGIKNLRFERLR